MWILGLIGHNVSARLYSYLLKGFESRSMEGMYLIVIASTRYGPAWLWWCISSQLSARRFASPSKGRLQRGWRSVNFRSHPERLYKSHVRIGMYVSKRRYLVSCPYAKEYPLILIGEVAVENLRMRTGGTSSLGFVNLITWQHARHPTRELL